MTNFAGTPHFNTFYWHLSVKTEEIKRNVTGAQINRRKRKYTEKRETNMATERSNRCIIAVERRIHKQINLL
jgi:hypothetical protein